MRWKFVIHRKKLKENVLERCDSKKKHNRNVLERFDSKKKTQAECPGTM